MDTFHKDHYKVYNFCCEYGRGYDPSVFYGRVKRYPFKDHNTPPLTTMVNFANDAKAWLDADKENVVNMHCKAGKGRAGLMCCVLLVRTGECPSAKAAMDLYDRTRVNNNKGLTVTSQRKYVIFFERLFREFWGVSGNIGDVPADAPLVVPEEPEVQIVGVEVLNGNAGALKALSVHLYQGTNLTPTHLDSADATSDQQFTFTVNARVKGNFKVRVDTKKGIHKKKVFEFWHNTLFLKQYVSTARLSCVLVHCNQRGETVIDFAPEEIDIKRKGLKKYGEKITLRLRFNWNGGASAVPVSHEAIELVKKDEAL